VVPEDRSSSAVLAGGIGGSTAASASIVRREPAAASGEAVAGSWPDWARPQLERAVHLAQAAPDDLGIARLLYREWFSPVVDAARPAWIGPMAGVYRAAHAGSGKRLKVDSLSVVDRFDLLGPDGWWRTWGSAWIPPRSRRGSVRLMLTPKVDRLADLVATVTGALLDTDVAWSLGCATRPRRLARYGAAVLDVPSLAALPAGLLADLEPFLHPVAPPLCLPVRPGIGLAEYPDNGMTFGEHRCHLVALALRHPSSDRDPLRGIAAVFNAHDIDPARPHAAR
jgi:type III HopA1-like effector protein